LSDLQFVSPPLVSSSIPFGGWSRSNLIILLLTLHPSNNIFIGRNLWPTSRLHHSSSAAKILWPFPPAADKIHNDKENQQRGRIKFWSGTKIVGYFNSFSLV
jgi:hypothetical protein